MTRAPGLAVRMEQRLREGSAHTLELARDILGLSGHPGAASAAVFALLGSDPRFRVDAGGIWTLDAAGGGVPLTDLSFAVVDVETTGGGVHKGHRITEIAIVTVEHGQIVDDWTTLVNPGRSIQPVVTAITGITPEMVDSAPFFEHIAPQVASRLDGRVFVAHNVAFDRGFVRHELIQAEGEAPSFPSLCTVRLARLLLQRLTRRNLDEVARHLDVKIEGRHRAWGDARATARILLMLLERAELQGIRDLDTLNKQLRTRSRRRTRPRRTPE